MSYIMLYQCYIIYYVTHVTHQNCVEANEKINKRSKWHYRQVT